MTTRLVGPRPQPTIRTPWPLRPDLSSQRWRPHARLFAGEQATVRTVVVGFLPPPKRCARGGHRLQTVRCRPGAHASVACPPRAAALQFTLGAASVVAAAAAAVPGHRGRL
eukprot:scaffold91462_cov46-Phaeocystis_antarctica.AAC.1